MILLTRIRTNPPVHENFFGQKRFDRNFKLLIEKRDGKLKAKGEKKWDSGFWKNSKEQLLLETFGKCAYCETPTTVVVYGDVEHFRPKSKYWWLAYSYENYLPSCSICNQKYKKDFFEIDDLGTPMTEPAIIDDMTDAELAAIAATITVDPIQDSEGMPINEFTNLHKAEKALILNPYYDNPADYLAYTPMLANQEIIVTPVDPKYKKIVETCEKLYGINRKELKKHRFQWYASYITWRYALETLPPGTPLVQSVNTRLEEMKKGHLPYTGMVRYFESMKLSDLPWDFNIVVAP